MVNGDYILVKAPKDFPGKKYRQKYCYEHILNYWKYYGIIPKDNELIHHINGNKHDNRISNLELKTRVQHTVDHNDNKKRTYVKLKCPGCNKVFIREKRNSYLSKHTKASCCSKECIGIYTSLPEEVKRQRISEMFIEEFKK